MYWRVRKITPEQLLRTYAVHIVLAISLLMNGWQYLTRPKKETMNAGMKQDFAGFAKQVTSHLLDTSYVNYMDSTIVLHKELSEGVLKKLKQDGILPANQHDMKANYMDFEKSRRVCAIQFQNVQLSDPNAQGMVPIDVQGVIAVHSSDESTQQPFHLQFLIGLKKQGEDLPPAPIVVDFRDLPPAPMPQAPQ
jgi:hypothetical protein